MSSKTTSLQNLLEVAYSAASKASDLARQHREKLGVEVSFKGDRNLVTTADVACEKIIVETIATAFPEHKILAEESARTLDPEEYGKGTTWVIDPIDGTTNYAHGHFHVGISIGCVIDGVTQVGVVAAPFLGEVFTATKGGGAFCNGRAIAISGTSSLSDALITTGFPYRRENSANICARIERVIRQCRDLRRLGAASLDMCWVACGRLDAYFEETLQPWDGCAGGLIAREAGAVLDHYAYDSELQRITERYPGDLFVDNIIVAAPELMSELKAVLNGTPIV